VKPLRSLLCCAFVLSSVPSLASADEPTLAQWAQRRVEDGLVKPLDAKHDRIPSRALPPPRARRVRVTQSTLSTDKSGRSFVPFSVDVKYGSSEWSKDDIVGCVYRETGELFVKKGDAYRPAEFLLGKNVKPVPGVCEAAATARS
jgi:hypothetical protein